MSPSWLVFRAVLLSPWLGYLCWSDATRRRLPNVLTLGGLAAALFAQAGWWGWAGVKDGLAAAGVSALFLLVPFLLRAAGAGDLKMLAACGAVLGMRLELLFLLAVSFAGVLVAGVMLGRRRVTTARVRHCFRCVFDWRYDRAAGRAALPAKDDERARVPFGVAIALGAWFALAFEAWKFWGGAS